MLSRARRYRAPLPWPALWRLGGPAALVLLGDWLTKTGAEQLLRVRQPVPVAGEFFRLTLGYNRGVAFGLFAADGPWTTLLGGAVILFLAGWLGAALHSGGLPQRFLVPAGLIAGGGLANFADRLPDGRVTDFLDFGVGLTRWPTFNLADTAITVGIAALLLQLLFTPASQAVTSTTQETGERST